FDDKTSVLSHGNHQWVTSSRKDKRRRYPNGSKNKPIVERPTTVKTTLEISSTLRVGAGCTAFSNHAVPLSQPIELPESVLPIDPYCLGVWLGDGHSAQAIIAGMEDDCSEILQRFLTAGFESRRLGKFW